MVTSEGFVGEREEEQVSQCRHHWLIDTAGGPTSKGVCRLCGAERQFKNYLENAPWDDDEPSSRDPVRAVVSSAGSSDQLEE